MNSIELTQKSSSLYVFATILLASLISIPYAINTAQNGHAKGIYLGLVFICTLIILSFILSLKGKSYYNKFIYTAIPSVIWLFYFYNMDKDNSSIIFFLTYPVTVYALLSYKKALVLILLMMGIFCSILLYYPNQNQIYVLNDFNLKVGAVYLIITIILSFWKRNNQKNLDQIQSLALFDSLTDVANRRHFQLYIENLINISKRNNRSFFLFVIDIEKLKNINDNFGHKEGDIVLKKIVSVLKQSLRTSDFIARKGGDEFIVVLPEINDEYSPAIIANRIIRTIEQKNLPKLNIGIVNYPEDGECLDELMEKADHALYYAKTDNDNAFSFYQKGFDGVVKQRITIANQLRFAITKKELHVLFQPKIDTASSRISGAEALLRWNNSLLGPVSPAEFISIAEDSDIIHTLSTWVYIEAFKMLKHVIDQGFQDFVLSVNVSPLQISKNTLSDSLNEALEVTGVSPENIELEITEGTLLVNNDKNASLLYDLRDRGFKIAIDDFGTGYSSLSYLQKLNVDSIKIDQSFIQNIEDHGAYSITNAIISIAKSLNLETIAEGVETNKQLEVLKALGCDFIQGFYYSKPIPKNEFMHMLQQKIIV